MCLNNKVSAFLKEGVIIDAPFPRNMELANEILQREEYDTTKDFLYITTQALNQFTKLGCNKCLKWMDDETLEDCWGRHFTLNVPDRYIPSTEETLMIVIRNSEDIDKLYEEMSKNEES